jgi:hypothetical protein
MSFHSSDDDNDEEDVRIRIPMSSAKKRRHSIFLESSDEDDHYSNHDDANKENNDFCNTKKRAFFLPDALSSSESEAEDYPTATTMPTTATSTTTSKLPVALRRTSTCGNPDHDDDDDDDNDDLYMNSGLHRAAPLEAARLDACAARYPGLRTATKSPRFNVVARNFSFVSHDCHAPSMRQSPAASNDDDDDDDDIECWSTDEERKKPARVSSASTDVIDLLQTDQAMNNRTLQNPYARQSRTASLSSSSSSSQRRLSTTAVKLNDPHISRHSCDAPGPPANPVSSRRSRMVPSTATTALTTTEPSRRRRDPSMAGAVHIDGLWYQPGAPRHEIHSLPLPANWRPRNDLFGGSGVGAGSYQLEPAKAVPAVKAAKAYAKKSCTKKGSATTVKKGAKRKYAKKKGGRTSYKKKGTTGGGSSRGSGRSRPPQTRNTNDAWSSGYQHRSSTTPVSRTDATLNHVGGASITF